MLELNNGNFEETIKSGITLVDFWAPWCGPCRMLTPVLENLADEMKESHIKFAKVNVDDNQDLAMKYDVSGIPNVIIFKDGNQVANLVGVKSITEYKAVLEELTKNSEKSEENNDSQDSKAEKEINILGLENFEKELKKDGKILIDFWAPWCGPCRMLSPVLEQVAKKTGATILKVNVDEPANQNLAYEYGISSIPHIFIFENGKEVENFVGLRSEEEILEILDSGK